MAVSAEQWTSNGINKLKQQKCAFQNKWGNSVDQAQNDDRDKIGV
jgi:hypothetical protein